MVSSVACDGTCILSGWFDNSLWIWITTTKEVQDANRVKCGAFLLDGTSQLRYRTSLLGTSDSITPPIVGWKYDYFSQPGSFQMRMGYVPTAQTWILAGYPLILRPSGPCSDLLDTPVSL